MGKILKFTISLCLIFLFSVTLSSCNNSKEINIKDKKVMINNVNYSSLTEAVANAKNKDIINIYNDVKDNKNILVNKPITIKGISANNQTKPKFYGSLTVDLSGKNDTLTIENIELIHSGKNQEGENNNSAIGINLIDGGLTLKSSIICLSSPEDTDNNATGLIISRKIDSNNSSPITISGNTFESYLTNKQDLSSAIKILSNQDKIFKTITLNEEELLNLNNFFTKDISNQLISLDLEDNIYTYYATTSLNDFIKALNKNQGTNNSTFILYSTQDQTLTEAIKSVIVNDRTSVYIYGNANLDFNNLNLKLSGTIETETKLNNLNIETISNIANIIDKSNQ